MYNIFSNKPRGKGLTYIVKPGDSLYKIAGMFDTTPASLMMLNHLHNTLLNVGQVLIIEEPELKPEMAIYDNYTSFLKEHKGEGILKVHVYTAGGLFPLKGVHVQISKIFKEKKHIFFEGETEESGIIDSIFLPTLLNSDIDIPKSTMYQVEASHPNYIQMSVQQTEIYNGIKSIQGIEMMPKSLSKEVIKNEG